MLMYFLVAGKMCQVVLEPPAILKRPRIFQTYIILCTESYYFIDFEDLETEIWDEYWKSYFLKTALKKVFWNFWSTFSFKNIRVF